MHHRLLTLRCGECGRRAAALLLASAAAFTPIVAHAAPLRQDAAAPSPSLWPLLLALFAAAFAIERLLELLWNYVEWILLNTRRMRATDIKSSAYTKFKSGTCVLLGAIAGVGLAGLFTLHLFAALQPLALGFIGPIPANWDVVLTGIVVGVLAKPIHDFIGILAGIRNFFDSAAVRQREEAGAAMADGVLKLAQSDAQGMIEVPGMGPTRLSGAYDTDAAPAAEEPSPTDRYIDVLHGRTTL